MELFIAGIVTILTQIIKTIATKFGYEKDTTRIAILLCVSLVAAGVYVAAERYSPGLMETFWKVVVLAAGWYALVIKRFEKPEIRG